jgi:hypothetical protein
MPVRLRVLKGPWPQAFAAATRSTPLVKSSGKSAVMALVPCPVAMLMPFVPSQKYEVAETIGLMLYGKPSDPLSTVGFCPLMTPGKSGVLRTFNVLAVEEPQAPLATTNT